MPKPRAPLAAALSLAGWVVLTYGFRLGTAVAQRTWDSVAASVVLLGLSAAVGVAAVRRRGNRPPVPWERPVVRVFAVVAAAWSVYRLVTTWTGDHGATFVTVHTVLAGVLLVLAVATWRSTASRSSAAGHSDGQHGQAAQRVSSAGGVPFSR